MKSQSYRIAVYIAIGILIYGKFSFTGRLEPNDHYSEVSRDLISIATSINMYFTLNPLLLDSGASYSGKDLYVMLTMTNAHTTVTRLLPFKPSWDASKTVIDPWGHEYSAFITNELNRKGLIVPVLHVSSAGPGRSGMERGHKYECSVILQDR